MNVGFLYYAVHTARFPPGVFSIYVASQHGLSRLTSEDLSSSHPEHFRAVELPGWARRLQDLMDDRLARVTG